MADSGSGMLIIQATTCRLLFCLQGNETSRIFSLLIIHFLWYLIHTLTVLCFHEVFLPEHGYTSPNRRHSLCCTDASVQLLSSLFPLMKKVLALPKGSVIINLFCGRSSSVELQLPKLVRRVRFPPSAFLTRLCLVFFYCSKSGQKKILRIGGEPMSPEDLQTGASAPTCECYYELQNEILQLFCEIFAVRKLCRNSIPLYRPYRSCSSGTYRSHTPDTDLPRPAHRSHPW
jgi:hypothetical protein